MKNLLEDISPNKIDHFTLTELKDLYTHLLLGGIRLMTVELPEKEYLRREKIIKNAEKVVKKVLKTKEKGA